MDVLFVILQIVFFIVIAVALFLRLCQIKKQMVGNDLSTWGDVLLFLVVLVFLVKYGDLGSWLRGLGYF